GGAAGGRAMLNFPPAVRIWLGTAPVDLRRSFDGLAEQVRQHLHNDPLSGHVFVFRNKRGDRIKLLYWDEDGFVIVYKRLEEGTFRWPAVAADPATRRRLLLERLASLHAARRDNEALRHGLDLLLRRLYGPRGERFDPNQALLFPGMAAGQDAAAAPAEAAPPAEPKRRCR